MADIAHWRLDGAGHAGIADPVAAMVMGPPRQAEALLVDGAPVVLRGELLTADLDAIARAAAATALLPA
jgi:hypothetical protein